MPKTGVGALSGRMAMMERRLNLVSEELAVLMSRSPPAEPAATVGNAGVEVFPTRIEFDADSLSPFAQGFSEREYDAEGIVFRWSGAGPICELRFFLDRSEDRPFRLVVGETQIETLTAIAGFVDYAQTPLFIEREKDKDVLTGVIPKRAYTRLAVVSFLLGQDDQSSLETYGDGEVGEYDDWTGFRFYRFSAG
jgi:hypothetical protein